MLTEIDRASNYADDFIKHHTRVINKLGLTLPIINGDFINEEKGFQEIVIQQIRIKGFKVFRHGDEYELTLSLEKE